MYSEERVLSRHLRAASCALPTGRHPPLAQDIGAACSRVTAYARLWRRRPQWRARPGIMLGPLVRCPRECSPVC